MVKFGVQAHENMKYDLSEISGVIRDRRTVYPEQFTDRVVQRDMLEQMLTNAIWAPTHGKTQPWRFVIYTGSGRNKLKTSMEQLYRQHTPMEEFNQHKLDRMLLRIDKTSAIIATVMARTENTKLPVWEEQAAVSCAAQNLLLTATAYGLGSFWSSPSFLSSVESSAAFGFSDKDHIMGLIYLGYPDGAWPKSHRKPLEYVTEWIENEGD